MDRVQGLFAAVASCSIPIILLLILTMDAYSTSPQPPFDESQESDLISTSIESANLHVEDAMQAIQQ
ncbi:MAG: hypothetical protein ACRD4W_07185, partial [Nitrososphaeraceae archaeon]